MSFVFTEIPIKNLAEVFIDIRQADFRNIYEQATEQCGYLISS